MKKINIPVIIAAVLGVGGGVAAVSLNIANSTAEADTEINDILKSGTYYLNGDVNAEMWIEVNPDFLTLKGTDIDKSLTEAAIDANYALAQSLESASIDGDFPVTQAISTSQLDELKQLYCAEKLYQLKYVGLPGSSYAIMVDRFNEITDRKELLKSNAGFRFNEQTNTIIASIGEFTLVE